jgi:Ca2+-binding RTX toxin-like protein
LSSSRQAYATNAPETFVLFVGDNQVWGGSGANILLGEHGHDVLFGGGAADVLDGGPGLDIQIGGDGDDTFRINADCEAIAGEVIDGGDGNDTVQSHLSSSQLAALGVTIVSVENFVTIPEHPDGDVHCVLFPFEEGNIRQPVVTVAWDDLPDPTSTFRTSDGVLTLNVTSTASAAVDVDLTFTLRVRGSAVQLMTDPVSVSPQDPATVVLDLDDFIPSWVDPQAGNPTIYTSAWISTRATIKYSTGTTESAYAPTLFGHIDTTTDEAVLYRSKALHTQYNSGDLFHGPADENPWSVDNGGKGRIIGVAEAYGSLTVPTE